MLSEELVFDSSSVFAWYHVINEVIKGAYKMLFCDGDKFWCSEIERKSTEQSIFQWRIF